jgi:hypothetical protein
VVNAATAERIRNYFAHEAAEDAVLPVLN